MAQPFASVVDAIAWLDDHIDYERVAPTRRSLPTLSGVERALGLLGDPHRSYPSVHLTGTNGKGSTTQMVSTLLLEQGLKVGTYTSPNLHRVNERIAVDLEPISDEALAEVLGRLALVEDQLDEPLTRFELLTIAAFEYFSDVAVDAAVVEVGLGGTWDSTNVIEGRVCVLTNVALDHTQVLGDTPEEMARDKAGIISGGSTVILGPVSLSVEAIVSDAADNAGAAELWRAGAQYRVVEDRLALGGRLVDIEVPGASFSEILVPLNGAHQAQNAACALAAVTAFLGQAPSVEVVESAFARVRVPGRLEVLGHRPLRVVDSAHNAAGARVLGAALSEGFDVEGSKLCVIGMLEGRDPRDLLDPLVGAGIEMVLCVAPESPRALSGESIAAVAEELGLRAVVAPSIEAGVDVALRAAGDDGLVLITGSLYVVGPGRQRLLEQGGSVA